VRTDLFSIKNTKSSLENIIKEHKNKIKKKKPTKKTKKKQIKKKLKKR
jgi:RNA processing factor Prp31